MGEYRRVYRGVCCSSSLCDAIQNILLNIPKPQILDDDDTVLRYVIVLDGAFALKENLMKPYPFRALSYKKKTFHYRLSRARIIVENAFGIIVAFKYFYRLFS